MELRLLSLISYFTAAAYLAAWIIHQSWALVAKIRAGIFHRKAAGRVLSLSALQETNDRFGILLKILAAAIAKGNKPVGRYSLDGSGSRLYRNRE